MSETLFGVIADQEKDIKELQKKVTELETQLKREYETIHRVMNAMAKSEAQNAIYREALEFYDGAHRQNWAIDLNRLSIVAEEALKENDE